MSCPTGLEPGLGPRPSKNPGRAVFGTACVNCSPYVVPGECCSQGNEEVGTEEEVRDGTQLNRGRVLV